MRVSTAVLSMAALAALSLDRLYQGISRMAA